MLQVTWQYLFDQLLIVIVQREINEERHVEDDIDHRDNQNSQSGMKFCWSYHVIVACHGYWLPQLVERDNTAPAHWDNGDKEKERYQFEIEIHVDSFVDLHAAVPVVIVVSVLQVRVPQRDWADTQDQHSRVSQGEESDSAGCDVTGGVDEGDRPGYREESYQEHGVEGG